MIIVPLSRKASHFPISFWQVELLIGILNVSVSFVLLPLLTLSFLPKNFFNNLEANRGFAYFFGSKLERQTFSIVQFPHSPGWTTDKLLFALRFSHSSLLFVNVFPSLAHTTKSVSLAWIDLRLQNLKLFRSTGTILWMIFLFR